LLRQAIAISAMNMRNVPRRLGTSLVVMVGIAGVVGVLVGLLSMAAGFQATLTTSAASDRGIVLGHGSQNEMNSWLSNEEVNILSDLEGLDAVSAELYTVIDLTQRGSGESAYVIGRGVTAAAYTVRPEVRITAGRAAEAGRTELLAGAKAAGEFLGLALGDQVMLRGTPWTVVGHFTAGGSATESELWMDLALAKATFRRDSISTMRVRFGEPSAVGLIRAQIDRDPRLNLLLLEEEDFFAAQSEARTALIETFTYFIAGIMAAGAVFAALNSMYVAVGSRKIEIATLRALGFERGPVVASVMAEAMALALIGGTAGAALIYTALDGYTTSTLNTASNTQVAFSFAVTPGLLTAGVLCALGLGAIGGLLPALHAARAPITSALLGR